MGKSSTDVQQVIPKLPSITVLYELLSDILRSPKRLQQIVASSYQHPNGFLKMKLARFPNGNILRVHRWQRQDPHSSSHGTEADIHSHRWCFTSLIVVGALEVHEFAEVDNAGDMFEKYACTPNLDGQYMLRYQGPARLERQRTEIFSAGQSYSVDTNTLHCAFSRSPETVTVVVQGPPLINDSTIYRRERHVGTSSQIERPLSADISHVLMQLVNYLGENKRKPIMSSFRKAPHADGEPLGTIASLSLILYVIATILVAIGLIILAVWQHNQVLSTIPLAIGTSIIASLLVQTFYARFAQERFIKKVAADTASAAVGYAESVLHNHFTRVVPRKIYPQSPQPLDEFRRDIAEQLRTSKFYRHKGDGASFAGFRLTKLAAHPDMTSKEMITLCVLDPRADRLVHQHARHKLRVRGHEYSREDLARKAFEIKEEVFITLVAMFDISHQLRVEVLFHRENLFFRSELFENGLFVSYYLGGDYPGTYLFERNTYVFDAFMLNFQQVVDCSDYMVRFSHGLAEEEFSRHLEELGCKDDIANLRIKRNERYQRYEKQLPFVPGDLF